MGERGPISASSGPTAGVVITKHRRERARAPRPLWREEASMDVTDVHAHRTRLCKLTISHRTGPAEV